MKISIFGNSCIDIVTNLDRLYMKELSLVRNVCNTVDSKIFSEIMMNITNGHHDKQYLGGCGANIAAWLSLLGENVEFFTILPVGDNGDFIKRNLEKNGVTLSNNSLVSNFQCEVIIVVSDDKERTFIDTPRPSNNKFITKYDKMIELSVDSDIIIIDGYFLRNDGFDKKLLNNKVIRNKTIVFCPNDISIIQYYQHSIIYLLHYCDYIFLNEGECEALFALWSYEKSVNWLMEQGKTGYVSLGSEGAIFFHGGSSIQLPAKVKGIKNIKNTNGAGDALTAGFLFKIMNGASLEEAADFALICAHAIICEEIGANPTKRTIDSIKNK